MADEDFYTPSYSSEKSLRWAIDGFTSHGDDVTKVTVGVKYSLSQPRDLSQIERSTVQGVIPRILLGESIAI